MIVTIALLALVLFVGGVVAGGVYSFIGPVLGVLVGCVWALVVGIRRSRELPIRLATICGPVAGHTPAGAIQPGQIQIAGITLPVATGTALIGADLIVGPDPVLCLQASLNPLGQIVTGSLTAANVGASSTLTYAGRVDAVLLPADETPGSIRFDGFSVPIATGTALNGVSVITFFRPALTLNAQLNAGGQIIAGRFTSTGPQSPNTWFWLELAYLVCLLGLALLYLYPDTPTSSAFTAVLTKNAQVTLEQPAKATLRNSLVLLPTGVLKSSFAHITVQHVKAGETISLGSSQASGRVLLMPGGKLTLLNGNEVKVNSGALGSFDRHVVFSWKTYQGTSKADKNLFRTTQTVKAVPTTSGIEATLSEGHIASSTPWDNLLLWLQDVRRWLHRALPSTVGPFPIGVLWLGALGSVIRGVTVTTGDDLAQYPWYYSSSAWHISRPAIGASFALFTYLFFLSILDPTASGKVGGQFGTYLLAFIVGYSDGTFAALIQRTINVLLGPGRPEGPGH